MAYQRFLKLPESEIDKDTDRVGLQETEQVAVVTAGRHRGKIGSVLCISDEDFPVENARTVAGEKYPLPESKIVVCFSRPESGKWFLIKAAQMRAATDTETVTFKRRVAAMRLSFTPELEWPA